MSLKNRTVHALNCRCRHCRAPIINGRLHGQPNPNHSHARLSRGLIALALAELTFGAWLGWKAFGATILEALQ